MPPRALRALARLLALLLVAMEPAVAGEKIGQASPALEEMALVEAARLAEPAPPRPSGTELLVRNLSRYFVTYPVPSEAAGVALFLETAQRTAFDFAVAVVQEANRAAAAEGTEEISAALLGRFIVRRLPSRVGAYDDVLFFPDRPGRSIAVETVDLAAFLDTGFTWDTLLALADAEVPTESLRPLGPDAVRQLASGVNAYSLLVLRLAGRLARLDLAPHADADHLRRAAAALAARAAGDASEGERPPAEERGSVFTEVATGSGVDFRHRTSPWLSRFRRYGMFAPTFSGGGVTASDLDGDGWIDLVLCGGAGCRWFRNQGDGSFLDVTGKAGLGFPGEARMALAADFDNDGARDLFLTYARDGNRLLRGLPDGRFVDATAESGLEREGDISGPAVAFDYDRDGLLDLYVGNFGNYLRGRHPWASENARNGMPNRLFRNLGDLRFRDVTAAAGVGDTGWTQAVSHFDHDKDGDQDLYLANDFGRNELFVNNGDGTFAAGGATTASDDPFHGMNVAFADLNRDGYGDILVTNIWAWRPEEDRLMESNSLLLSQPSESGPRYRRESSLLDDFDTGWAWAGNFLDFDNDGLDDLFVANGFTDYLTFLQYRRHPEIPNRLVPINNGSEANFLFRGEGGGRFDHVADSGAEIDGVNSRSAVVLDYDRDGDPDLAVTTFHSRARLLRNDLDPPGRWLRLSLRGNPERGVNRDGIGATVVATGAAGVYGWRTVAGGGGYLSMDAAEIELGLGDADRVTLDVAWPAGPRQRLHDLPADHGVLLFR